MMHVHVGFYGGPLNGQYRLVEKLLPSLEVAVQSRRNLLVTRRWEEDVRLDDPPPSCFATARYFPRRYAGEVFYVHEDVIREEQQLEHIRVLEGALDGHLPDLRELHMPIMLAEVWGCGDECGCTCAQIVGWKQTVLRGGEYGGPFEAGWRRGYRELWRGPFHTEHDGAADTDLSRCSSWIRLVAPTLHTLIRWP